jgi:hypothetical protein
LLWQLLHAARQKKLQLLRLKRRLLSLLPLINPLQLRLISLLLLQTNPMLLLQISPHLPSNILAVAGKADFGRLFSFLA